MVVTSESLPELLPLEVLGPNAQVQVVASEIWVSEKMTLVQTEKDLIVSSSAFGVWMVLHLLPAAEMQIARDVDRLVFRLGLKLNR
jgi:hypothetical protein